MVSMVRSIFWGDELDTNAWQSYLTTITTQLCLLMTEYCLSRGILTLRRALRRTAVHLSYESLTSLPNESEEVK